MIRARAITSSKMFVLDCLSLGDNWSPIDLGDPKVKAAVKTYAGSHLQVYWDDVAKLADHGLALDEGRVVDAAPPAAAAADHGEAEDVEAETETEADDGPAADEGPTAVGTRRGRRAKS